MEAISDLSVGDVRRVFRRYVPVVAVVVTVAVMGLTLPGPKLLGGRTLPTFSSSAGAGSSSSAVITDDSSVAEDAAAVPADVTSSFSDASATAAGFADAPASPVRLPFPTPTAASRGDEPGNAPATFEAPPPPDSTATAAAVQPLRITSSAWASKTAGTPLASNGVPAGSLPVGKRVSQHDKRSFIRLSGSSATLVLAPHQDAAGQRTPQAGSILACQITDPNWKAGTEPMAFDAAPAYDATKCTLGQRGEDGAWTFDLKAFPLRTDSRGFALVPGPDAPLDFQVAFKAG